MDLELQLKTSKCHDLTRYKETDPTGKKIQDLIPRLE